MKIFSGFLLVCLFSVLALTADAQGSARIVAARVRGEVFVTVKATSVRTQIADNAEVSQGSIVTTAKDSSVVLVFSNGATINLGTDSLLDIEQFTQDPFSTPINASTMTEEPSKSTTKLTLTRGELVGKVAKLKKDQGSSFTVGTPVGAAGIRGTVFRVVFRPDGTGKAFFSLTVQVGDVELSFTGTVGGAPVSVTDNKEVSGDVNISTDANGVTTVTVNGQSHDGAGCVTRLNGGVTAAVQELAQALFDSLNSPPAPGPAVQSTPNSLTPLTGQQP